MGDKSKRAAVTILIFVIFIVGTVLVIMYTDVGGRIINTKETIDMTPEVTTGRDLASSIRRLGPGDKGIVTEEGSFGLSIEITGELYKGKCEEKSIAGKLISDKGISLALVYNKDTKHYIKPASEYETLSICEGREVIGKYYKLIK